MLTPCIQRILNCPAGDVPVDGPALAITMPATHDGATPFDATLTWNEDVLGFDVGDINATGPVVLGGLLGGPSVFTLTAIPTGANDITLDVAAGVATNLALVPNPLPASAGSIFAADTAQPTLVISGPSTHDGVTPFEATFTFSEPVVGFTLGDIVVALGTDSNLLGGPTVYTATITPLGTNDVTIQVFAAAAQDFAGNNSLAAVPLVVPNVDTIAPTVVITSDASHSNVPFFAEINFSEPVTGLTIGEITATNATLSNLVGSGVTYTVLVTPTGELDVSLDVAAAVAQDGAGNDNLAATQVVVPYVDVVRPTVGIDAPGTHNGATPFGVTFTFSEDVTGFTGPEVVVTNGVLSALAGGPAVYTATITPSAPGININITVPSGVAQDGAGNNNLTSGATGVLFAPFVLTSIADLDLWLDMTDLDAVWQDDAMTTLAGIGDSIGGVTDKSGGGNHATQASAANRPVLEAAGIHGDGVDDYLEFNEIADARALFVVALHDTGAQADTPIMGHSSNFDFHGGDSPADNDRILSGANASASVTGGDLYLSGNPALTVATFPKPVGMTVVAFRTTGNVSVDNISIDRLIATRSWDGVIAEVVIYRRALTDLEMNDVGNYLAGKHGLTWNDL